VHVKQNPKIFSSAEHLNHLAATINFQRQSYTLIFHFFSQHLQTFECDTTQLDNSKAEWNDKALKTDILKHILETQLLIINKTCHENKNVKKSFIPFSFPTTSPPILPVLIWCNFTLYSLNLDPSDTFEGVMLFWGLIIG